MLYRVRDPQHVYPIAAVEIEKDNPGEAAVAALEAMMGCSVLDVAEPVVTGALESLEVLHCVENEEAIGWVPVEHSQAESMQAYWNKQDDARNAAMRCATCDDPGH